MQNGSELPEYVAPNLRNGGSQSPDRWLKEPRNNQKRWRVDPTEENFWGMVVSYAGVGFKTYSGLPFSYEIKKGRNGEYTKELWIDRRGKSKSLAWSSVLLALKNIKGEVVDRPKALGDIRGVTYIYGMFYRFGLIDVPDEVKEKMGHPKDRKNRLLCAKVYGKMCRN